MTKTTKAHFAVFIVNLIYGANFAIAKGIMPRYISPEGLVAVRVFFAFLLFLSLHLILIREKIEKADLFKLVLCGLFGVALNQMLFFKGLSITSPINGAIIMTVTPILVVITAGILIKERISARKLIGIFLGLSGAILLLTSGKHISFSSESFRGDVFIFINAASYAVFLVLAKPLMKKYNPVTIITYTFFFGALMVIPFGVKDALSTSWVSLPTSIWIGILYVIVGVTFLAYLLNTMALNELSPSVVSFYIYLQPVFTTLISFFLLHENITLLKTFSSILIFIGVWLSGSKTKNPLPLTEI